MKGVDGVKGFSFSDRHVGCKDGGVRNTMIHWQGGDVVLETTIGACRTENTDPDKLLAEIPENPKQGKVRLNVGIVGSNRTKKLT